MNKDEPDGYKHSFCIVENSFTELDMLLGVGDRVLDTLCGKKFPANYAGDGTKCPTCVELIKTHTH